jgi:hypothetical protein
VGLRGRLTGPGAAAPRRRWSTSTPRTARASTRPPTWPSSGACCRWTATRASRACWRAARRTGSSSRSVGPTAEGLLRAPPVHRLAAGGGGAAPDRRALPDRGRDPRPPAEERRTVRQERSKPIVEALHAWLTIQLARVSGRSTLAEAIRYALRHWRGWCCSSTTAGSSSTRTSSSEPSGRSPSAGRTPVRRLGHAGNIMLPFMIAG